MLIGQVPTPVLFTPRTEATHLKRLPKKPNRTFTDKIRSTSKKNIINKRSKLDSPQEPLHTVRTTV